MGSARVTKLWIDLRSGAWLRPLLALAGGVALGLVAPRAEAWFIDPGRLPTFLQLASPGGVRDLLSVATGALVTTLTISFAMTMVTVQLASSQYSIDLGGFHVMSRSRALTTLAPAFAMAVEDGLDLDGLLATAGPGGRPLDLTRSLLLAYDGGGMSALGVTWAGGEANLVLTEAEDPLDAGLDIVARPPGKKPQSLSLLSGGEQTLTATALIFAVFLTNPAPICVLDEIDAPLDDANIGRFVEMLRSMLDRTQFIIITHNRKTMEIANRLYGVTMEEPGVSKLISIQLN